MGWISAAKYALAFVGATAAVWIGEGYRRSSDKPGAVVNNTPRQLEIIEIVNASNVRLNALADQHSQQQSNIEQLYLVGAGVLIVVLLIVVLCGCGCCVYYYCQRKNRAPRGVQVFGLPTHQDSRV